MLLLILLVALTNFIVGSIIEPSESEKAKGFLGYDRKYIELKIFVNKRFYMWICNSGAVC